MSLTPSQRGDGGSACTGFMPESTGASKNSISVSLQFDVILMLVSWQRATCPHVFISFSNHIDIVQRDQTLRSIITWVDHGISLLL